MKFYVTIFLFFSLFINCQTATEVEQKIKESPILISQGKKDEFIKVMNETIQRSTKIGYPYGIASGYYGKAYVAYLNHDLSGSIDFAKLAEKENLGLENSKLKADIYHLLGQNYASLGINDEALNYYRKMVISSKNIPDKKKSITNENIAYNDLASIYQLNKNNKDSAYYYMTKIYKSLNNYNDRDDKLNTLLAKATAGLAVLNIKEKKTDSADYYQDKSLKQISPQISETSSNDPNVFKHLSSVYASQGQYDKAKKYADIYTKAVEKTKVLADIKDANKLNYELSEEIKDSSNAYKYLKTYSKLNDSINQIDQKSIGKIYKDRLQENKQFEKENNYLKYFLILTFLIMFGLIYYVYLLIQRVKKKNKDKKFILIEKEFEIVNLESKINAAFEEVVSLAKSNSPNFLTRFKEVYPDFCDDVIKRYPNIQNSELIFCAYIRLNFSSKDIANFIFVTPKTVQMRKYRLRKKLNIPSDVDIYVWMNNL